MGTANSTLPKDSMSRPSHSIPGGATVSSSAGAHGAPTVAKLPENIAANFQSSAQYNSPHNSQGDATPASRNSTHSPLAAATMKPMLNGAIKAGRDSQAIGKLYGHLRLCIQI